MQKRVPISWNSLFKKVAMTYSPTNLCSTIGAVGLNFSVRDGKRWIPNAINRLNKGPIYTYRYRTFEKSNLETLRKPL